LGFSTLAAGGLFSSDALALAGQRAYVWRPGDWRAIERILTDG
jgi:hypothetical protein